MQKQLRLFLCFLLLIGSMASWASSLEEIMSQCFVQVLFQYAGLPGSKRDDSRDGRKEFFLLYKNDPLFRSWAWMQQERIVKIYSSYPEALSESKKLERYLKISQLKNELVSEFEEIRNRLKIASEPVTYYWGQLKAKKSWLEGQRKNRKVFLRAYLYDSDVELSQREAQILLFKTGDKIVYTSADGTQKSLVLGRFLGAGNASHIFALQSDPTRVVKFPFVSVWRGTILKNRYRDAKMFMDKFIELEEVQLSSLKMPERAYHPYLGKLPGILDGKSVLSKIVDHDKKKELAIVEKVEGILNGKQFLRQLYKKYSIPKDLDGVSKIHKFMQKITDDSDSAKLLNLIKTMVALNIMQVEADGGYREWDLWWKVRQLVYDEQRKQWVLVDWE